jgi:hypothetical protein
MDSYKRDGKDKEQAKKPAPPRAPNAGTGGLDSFQSGTGALGKGGTRKLGTSALDVDKAIAAMATEVENGKIIVSKLEGRIAVLMRAIRIMDKPLDANQICAGISAGEANFTKQVAKVLSADPGVTRRVQVALYQFDQARKGLQQSAEALDKVHLYDGASKGQFVESQLHVEKLRGQLYPLINLHVVFKDNALLSQLIPTPKAAPVEEPPPPPPPPPPVEEKTITGPLAGPLANSQLANDPAVQQVVETFNRVTGNLKASFGSFFKAPAKPEEKK